MERHVDDNGQLYYVARIAEIPALRIDGDSPEHALLRLDETFDDFIGALVEAGDEVPEPLPWPYALGYVPGQEVEAPSKPVTFSRESDGMKPWSAPQGDARLLVTT